MKKTEGRKSCWTVPLNKKNPYIKPSVVDPGLYWIRIRSILDPDPFSEYGSTHVNIG